MRNGISYSDVAVQDAPREGHFVRTESEGSIQEDRAGAEQVGLQADDLVGRRLAEEALRGSEERLRAIFEQSAAGIAQIDPNGRFLLVNQWLCDLLGYTRE